ncbi:MAG TPA: IPT/TIG domain-containing protein, partial [Thermoanaerobaculia bacterium]|nr:IPT/TIG domain-containing protein [Thermoanaerobaculia bacterium]
RKSLLLFALTLFALGAGAAPTLVRVTPSRGVSFDMTSVRLLGFDLAPNVTICRPEAQDQCATRVFFGPARGIVYSVSQDTIVASAPPQRAGLVVDVSVQLANGTQLVMPNAFTYVDEPEPKREEYRAYLVPLRTGEVHGANGSLWRTDLSLHNASEEDVRILANDCDVPFRTPVCAHMFIPVRPSQTIALQLEPGLPQFEGTFLYVPKAADDEVDATMRVRDVSRVAEGFGTDVPIVPLEEMRTSIRLLDVPTDPRYRTMLRVYGDSEWGREVLVTVYPMSGGEVLSQRIVRMDEGEGLWDEQPFPFVASYVRLDPITDAVRASGHQRVRVQVDAVVFPRADPPIVLPHWAFISVTNNVTQQVTTILPHR